MSTGEVKAQLYVSLDAGLIDEDRSRSLYDLASEAGRLVGGLMWYLSKSAGQGRKPEGMT